MLLEVRLQKPSKPIRWKMPTDFSLREALLAKQAEDQSRLDGTLAVQVGDTMQLNATLGSTAGGQGSLLGGSHRKSLELKEPPRHERFIECGTRLELIAQLHRMLEHPRPPPSVLQGGSSLQLPPIGSADRLDSTRPPPPASINSARSAGNADDDDDDARLRREEALKDLQKRLLDTPFTRMAFIFKYSDDETLRSINEAIAKVNSRALPDIQGSLR